MFTPILIAKYAQLKGFYISKLSQKYDNAQKHVDISCKKYIIKLWKGFQQG